MIPNHFLGPVAEWRKMERRLTLIYTSTTITIFTTAAPGHHEQQSVAGVYHT